MTGSRDWPRGLERVCELGSLGLLPLLPQLLALPLLPLVHLLEVGSVLWDPVNLNVE
jgi:hypothetical protein